MEPIPPNDPEYEVTFCEEGKLRRRNNVKYHELVQFTVIVDTNEVTLDRNKMPKKANLPAGAQGLVVEGKHWRGNMLAVFKVCKSGKVQTHGWGPVDKDGDGTVMVDSLSGGTFYGNLSGYSRCQSRELVIRCVETDSCAVCAIDRERSRAVDGRFLCSRSATPDHLALQGSSV